MCFDGYVSWGVCQLSHVPGRCYHLRGLIRLLLCRLGWYREAYGSDDTPALNFSVQGLKLSSGTLGDAYSFPLSPVADAPPPLSVRGSKSGADKFTLPPDLTD